MNYGQVPNLKFFKLQMNDLRWFDNEYTYWVESSTRTVNRAR